MSVQGDMGVISTAALEIDRLVVNCYHFDQLILRDIDTHADSDSDAELRCLPHDQKNCRLHVRFVLCFQSVSTNYMAGSCGRT